ncbi:hypothetical protein [Vibrio marisflavi]|uniref:Uncharacterized protein n=1 Tax=Vibrio marisflavi CECT 7928 TaxID=634439 RepID=A0ABN8DX30_9VIBR|nr:hypothetical protein [Vibrio marisflavi]CAH0536101.1 hypothetical protein VMF7928_00197 [Vibrio marisflavi CECT 7928]
MPISKKKRNVRPIKMVFIYVFQCLIGVEIVMLGARKKYHHSGLVALTLGAER